MSFPQARIMLEEELPRIARNALLLNNYDDSTQKALEKHIECVEIWAVIQQELKAQGLVAFIADGAILPRRSGDDDRPMAHGFETFVSPKSLKVSFELPGGKTISGMGIPEGVTCMTGGGFHGKSTLMDALCLSIYPHIPGDGREYVITRKDAVYIQAEDGRSIRSVDISPFIANLPSGKNPERFITDDASGSTSQAAAMIESVEAGAGVLLLDEDTCATNLLMRDGDIQRILPADKEPIRPLADTVRSMWEDHGISMLLVVGGLGAFLKQADTVLLLDEYKCHDLTQKVRELFGPVPHSAVRMNLSENNRQLSNNNFSPSFYNKNHKKEVPVRIKPHHSPLKKLTEALEYGRDHIELGAIRQIQGYPQLRTIGWMIYAIREEMLKKPDARKSVRKWLDWIEDRIHSQGLAGLKVDYPGLQAIPPRIGLAAAINRIRSLEVIG